MSVAVVNSPVFSPSSSLFLNKPSSAGVGVSIPKSPTSHFNSSSRSPSSPLRFRTTSSSLSPSPEIASSASADGSRRKRPPRLAIPVPAMGFGGCDEVAAAEKEEVEREGDGYAVFSKRGKRKRKSMEDRFSAVVDIHGDPKQAFFGVFDGHGGAKAAKYAAKNLGKNILKRISSGEEEIEDAIKQGYLDTDSQFMNEETRGGSCCVTALIREGKLIVSNAGDCRAVVSRGGVAEALTFDHRPGREDERHRIESTGGYVDMISGTWRIQGTLAVSRAIGDRHLKQWVIAEPDTQILEIQPNSDEFLIMGSDGLWDKVSNQEAVNIALADMKRNQPLLACKKLVELSIYKGSNDDVTVMIIQLGGYI
ncbi:Probable protein phosphatase 2C 2 [Linum perenne]